MSQPPNEQATEPISRSPQQARLSPNQTALLIIAIMLTCLILLVLISNGWNMLMQQRASRAAMRDPLFATVAPLGGAMAEARSGVNPAAVVPPVSVAAQSAYAVSPTFQNFYDTHGGERLLGWPIGPPENINGREIQWFERARLEHWPEHAGTPYEVQLGRLGVEYTQGRTFARQSYFASSAGLRYFPETGHGVEGIFLAFWEQYGGLESFGLPISEAFDEVQTNGVAYRVQYFERTRMEYHPEFVGSLYEVQLGRLGAALLSNEARPTTVQPVPTALPLP